MSITRHHIEWLSLVPNSGPFLSLPVLAQAFPQGLDSHDADHARQLRTAFNEWDEDQLSKRPDPGIHPAWIKSVLEETLGYGESACRWSGDSANAQERDCRIWRDAEA